MSQLDIEVKELKARVKQLEAALKPFGEVGASMLQRHGVIDFNPLVLSVDGAPVSGLDKYGFTFGHFRAAARIIRGN
jgi:hypothetical protein